MTKVTFMLSKSNSPVTTISPFKKCARQFK